jgi:hypothetical protein
LIPAGCVQIQPSRKYPKAEQVKEQFNLTGATEIEKKRKKIK